MINKKDITSVILAGGQARRMQGRDKGLILLNGRPMIRHILDIIIPQVERIIINANRHHEEYAKFGFPVITDELSGYCGPLAGMASALNTIKTAYLVTVPCDTPFIPNNMIERLTNKLIEENADICVVDDGERIQPVFSIIKCELLSSLQSYLEQGGRRVDHFFEQNGFSRADFSDMPEAFVNVNTFADVNNALVKINQQV